MLKYVYFKQTRADANTPSLNEHSTALTIAIFCPQSHVQVDTFAPMKEMQLFKSPQLSGQV